MKDERRWIPTDTEINRLLSETDCRRSELQVSLRNQKVSRQQKSGRYKTIVRVVHFIYFEPRTRKWTGNIHVDQTNWQPVEFNLKRRMWFEIREDV